MPKLFANILTVLTFCLCFSSVVQAQLLISPTRVVLDERQRSAKVVLINPTQQTRTYRLTWQEKNAKPEGGYIAITEGMKSQIAPASPMLRISPKQVTLRPGERQVVKVLSRRPKGLEDGEYRSHLAFTPIPDTGDKDDADTSGGASFKIDAIISFSIPVMVRQGSVKPDVKVNDVRIVQYKKAKTADILLDVSRTGMHSATGNFMIYWQPNGSKEELVAQVHGYNLYSELKQYLVKLSWKNFSAQAGSLRVEYTGKKELAGKIAINKTFVIEPNMIEVGVEK